MDSRNCLSRMADKEFPSGYLVQAIYAGYLANPSKQMVSGENESITYQQAYSASLALASYLYTTGGIRAGSVLMLCAPNIPEYPIVVAAAQMCAARLVLISATVEREEFCRAVHLMQPDLLVVYSDTHSLLARELAPKARLLTIPCFFAQKTSVKHYPRVPLSYKKDAFQFQRIESESEIVLFSSGTTGMPKGIIHQPFSFRRNAQSLIDVFAANANDILFLPVPFSHVYGLLGIYVALFISATLVTTMKYRPETSLRLIAKKQASLYFGVPTMYLRELRVNKKYKKDLSSLRAGLVAGAPCPEVVFDAYERRYSCRLMQSYGMTETAATLTVSSLNWPLSIRASSVGLPIKGAKVRIDEETGEVCCKTLSLMKGVIGVRGECELEVDREGWFHTGDIGAYNNKGQLRIVGRIKDVIIRGGVNIYPAEIENVFHNHPLLAECCLVGYYDADLGERSCLCVIMNTAAKISPQELRQYGKGRIEKNKIPDRVQIMSSFPRLENGKIDKKRLKSLIENARKEL